MSPSRFWPCQEAPRKPNGQALLGAGAVLGGGACARKGSSTNGCKLAGTGLMRLEGSAGRDPALAGASTNSAEGWAGPGAASGIEFRVSPAGEASRRKRGRHPQRVSAAHLDRTPREARATNGMMKRTQSELPHGVAMSMNLGLNRTFGKLSDDSGANANGAPAGAVADRADAVSDRVYSLQSTAPRTRSATAPTAAPPPTRDRLARRPVSLLIEQFRVVGGLQVDFAGAQSKARASATKPAAG